MPFPSLGEKRIKYKHNLGYNFNFEINSCKTLILVNSSFFFFLISRKRASLVAHMLENPPALQETWIQSLGRGDLLEKRMATYSGILAWEITWTEEPGRLQSMAS